VSSRTIAGLAGAARPATPRPVPDKWTKADIARVQHAIDLLWRVFGWPAELVRAFPRAAVQAACRDAVATYPDGRERRACVRLHDRLDRENLPDSVELPYWPHKIDAADVEAPPPEPPTPLHDYPLTVAMDGRLAYPVHAAVREQRFPVVHDWRAWGAKGDIHTEYSGATEYDAPREHWHSWAAGVAADMGAAVGWAKVAHGAVTDGHPASGHVKRVLCEAASRLEPPAGVVALDLRGLGRHLAAAVVEALVAAADARLARDGWVRCCVLICDPLTALYLDRCVRLYAGQP